MIFENTLEFAQSLDKADPLKKFRDKFYIPILHGKDSIYFAGNSLGLQPKTAQGYVLDEMENWANYGVEGHFHGKNPWIKYHDAFPKKLASILGALPEEIVIMNQLTVNLHLLLISFYRPDKKRYKIICEEKAFPSDQYAIESHFKLHGIRSSDALIEIAPRAGEHSIRNEDIISTIKKHGSEIALVIIGGINYYSGQVFDMKSITESAHAVGAVCGFDLAHAVGNIELMLHEWNVDFACWCSYKYLNSGPGSIAGAFIHQRYITDKSLLRLAGWCGTNKHERFQMKKDFDPIPTAEGWQVSNTEVLCMAPHLAALDIIEEVGFEKIIEKGKKLSAYTLFILNEINAASSKKIIEIITPQAENEHGCQVSMLMLEKGKEIFEFLNKKSVIADWREPNVIRIAPVPLYNTFEDVYQFGKIINNFLETEG
ncbi:MAG: kynureninase [Bacteroidota bacterium]|nr:kynureninase [Bacteroidota bacterium]